MNRDHTDGDGLLSREVFERLVRSTLKHVVEGVPKTGDFETDATEAAMVLIASAHDLAAAVREGDRLGAIEDLRDILDRLAVRMREIR